jgi:SAM-dependent methyltransferase
MALFKSIDNHIGIRNRIRGLPAAGFDLEGEKPLDWGWVIAQLSCSTRQDILDVGCRQSPVVTAAGTLGHNAVGVDMDPLPFQVPSVTFHQGDFLELDLGEALFDFVVLCSVVEHIGLPGRYRQKNVPDADLLAMRKAARLLRPAGKIILTVPVGLDMVLAPWHRIYGLQRLPKLLEGLSIESERYFVKHRGCPWRLAQRAEAVTFNGKGLSYALGQYVLKTRGG